MEEQPKNKFVHLDVYNREGEVVAIVCRGPEGTWAVAGDDQEVLRQFVQGKTVSTLAQE
jgi:hypothetical protein